jgi:hypothetical protein
VHWQSGNRSSVTTGVDNALTGLGGQRAVQVSDSVYGSGAPTSYLDRAAFTSPATGTYSSLAPFTIVNPSSLQTDFALTRTFKIQGAQSVQFRWEVFNVLNNVKGDLRRYRLAWWMIRHEVRTGTVALWSGLSIYRVKAFREAYAGGGETSHRGPSPYRKRGTHPGFLGGPPSDCPLKQ